MNPTLCLPGYIWIFVCIDASMNTVDHLLRCGYLERGGWTACSFLHSTVILSGARWQSFHHCHVLSWQGMRRCSLVVTASSSGLRLSGLVPVWHADHHARNRSWRVSMLEAEALLLSSTAHITIALSGGPITICRSFGRASSLASSPG